MNRKRQIRKLRKSYLIIVEGQTEKWYLDLFKKHEQDRLPRIDIKPEIPKRKKLKEIHEQILDNEKQYDKVIWIVDLDVIIADNQITEFKKIIKNLEKMKKVIVLVNSPCLEFWFLLHHVNTSRFFSKCKNVEKELHKVDILKEYEKTEKYFKSSNDIYNRLKPYQRKAIKNAESLGVLSFNDINSAKAEINQLFEIVFDQSNDMQY